MGMYLVMNFAVAMIGNVLLEFKRVLFSYFLHSSINSGIENIFASDSYWERLWGSESESRQSADITLQGLHMKQRFISSSATLPFVMTMIDMQVD